MDIFLNLRLIEQLFIFEIYLSVSLWEYVSFQTKTEDIKYTHGYGYFSLIQWLAVGIGLVSIFGLKIGLIAFGFCLIVLQYICHFTLGLILDQFAKSNKDLPLALFAINTWVLLIITIFITLFN